MTATAIIKYGISLKESIDVTKIITDFLKKHKAITTKINVNNLIGCDPYKYKKKKVIYNEW